MASRTTDIDIATVRRIVRENAAGTAHSVIARGLNDDGIAVPRWDENIANGTPPATCEPGYNLITRANPGPCWDAAAVAAVLASPQAVSTNSYAAAQAVLGSAVTTRLTIA